MWDASHEALPAILVQPRVVCAICPGLAVPEPGNGRESLSPTEQRPSADDITVYRFVDFEERSSRRDIDSEVPVGESQPRLEMTFVQSMGVNRPGIIVPLHMLELVLLAAARARD